MTEIQKLQAAVVLFLHGNRKQREEAAAFLGPRGCAAIMAVRDPEPLRD